MKSKKNMNTLFKTKFFILNLFFSFLLMNCATPYNYEKFLAAKPRSILILPPVNLSTDVRGTYSYLSTVTKPVAEKGFYVYPVDLIDTMMKENGLPSANEMHQASLKKIREIINPDTVLYLTLEQYGTSFVLLSSETTVTVSGKLVSTKTGEIIWEGRSSANQSSASGGGGLGAMLINAVVSQAVNSTTDHAHKVSEQANNQLFYTKETGLLNGPYSLKPYE